MKRRKFIQAATIGATSLAGLSWTSAFTAEDPNWPIGSFNRAWTKWETRKDPLAELEPIARHVTGFCAKDSPAPKGEMMSQFDTGKVDFKAVFAKLKSVGFNGPIMVEGVKVGATAEETTANARANRKFLEKVLAAF